MFTDFFAHLTWSDATTAVSLFGNAVAILLLFAERHALKRREQELQEQERLATERLLASNTKIEQLETELRDAEKQREAELMQSPAAAHEEEETPNRRRPRVVFRKMDGDNDLLGDALRGAYGGSPDGSPSADDHLSFALRTDALEFEFPVEDVQSQAERDKEAAEQRRQEDEAHAAIVEVFYATNRAETGSKKPSEIYGADRGKVSYGIANVSIPPGHKLGLVERPKWYRLELSENPAKHVVLTSLTRLDKDTFFGRAKDRMGSGEEERPVMVFIHGYNVTFAAAAHKTAQIAFDMFLDSSKNGIATLNVLPFLFSWPSNGAVALYTHDGPNSEVSGPPLAQFLRDLKQKLGPRKIAIIAHSMGNRALTLALHEIGAAMAPNEHPIVQEVIFAAPDIDREIFAQHAAAALRTGQRATIYASASDSALALSRGVNGFSRLGDLEGGIAIYPSADSIDASAVGTDLFAHGYVGEPTVLNDMHALIKNGTGPMNRFGLIKCGPPLYYRIRPRV